MQFKIREIGGFYADVIAVEGNTKIELGLLDEKQRRQLADELQSAIDDLLHGLIE